VTKSQGKTLWQIFAEDEMKQLTTISYGGGVQSTAMLVLAAQGRLGYEIDAALFANVGEKAEHPETLRYVREIAAPFAQQHGIALHELHRRDREGNVKDLYEHLIEGTKEGKQSDIIPLRGEVGAPMSRGCTRDYKILVVGKWLKANGATAENPANVCIGISTDEITRLSNKRQNNYERPVYPLIELGLSRNDCLGVIRDAGLEVPPKSACYFCPFTRPNQWAEMRRDQPELFWKAAELEALMNERRERTGVRPLYLSRFAKPLPEAIPEAQEMLPLLEMAGGDGCDSGHCWT
jgi:PP-loop superfamily ATP-utilizing enzyme